MASSPEIEPDPPSRTARLSGDRRLGPPARQRRTVPGSPGTRAPQLPPGNRSGRSSRPPPTGVAWVASRLSGVPTGVSSSSTCRDLSDVPGLFKEECLNFCVRCLIKRQPLRIRGSDKTSETRARTRRHGSPPRHRRVLAAPGPKNRWIHVCAAVTRPVFDPAKIPDLILGGPAMCRMWAGRTPERARERAPANMSGTSTILRDRAAHRRGQSP